MIRLSLDRNQISDVCPIVNLTSLTCLHLKDNPIQDMAPLQKLLKHNQNLQVDIPAPVELKIQQPPANK